jgi:uncharacterized damage-inducible protein DinB
MLLRDHFLRTFEFNVQANLRIVEAMKSTDAAIDDALAIMGHVLHAEKLWFLRLDGFDTGSIPTWPKLTLDECFVLAAITGDNARSFIRRLDASALDQHVQYCSVKGDVFENSITDILNHISHHGAYHRAQINRILREHGAAPAIVDFISFARE